MKLALASLVAFLCFLPAGSASAQPPGGLLFSQGCPLVDLHEGPTEVFADEHFAVNLPCQVFSGYVVLLESADPTRTQDPRNWSDVIKFGGYGSIPPGSLADVVWFLSDSADPSTGIENGITPADLAFAGVTAADVVSGANTVYIVEGSRTIPGSPDANLYDAPSPATSEIAHYVFRSDPPESPTPAPNSSWGRVKGIYR
jgi:hypothetical protein